MILKHASRTGWFAGKMFPPLTYHLYVANANSRRHLNSCTFFDLNQTSQPTRPSGLWYLNKYHNAALLKLAPYLRISASWTLFVSKLTQLWSWTQVCACYFSFYLGTGFILSIQVSHAHSFNSKNILLLGRYLYRCQSSQRTSETTWAPLRPWIGPGLRRNWPR